MKVGFWGLNAGLVLMVFTSLLPVGLFQFEASTSVGMWYARSDTFLQQPFLETLRWIRTIGDVVFIVGAVAVAWRAVTLGLWRQGARWEPPAAALVASGGRRVGLGGARAAGAGEPGGGEGGGQ